MFDCVCGCLSFLCKREPPDIRLSHNVLAAAALSSLAELFHLDTGGRNMLICGNFPVHWRHDQQIPPPLVLEGFRSLSVIHTISLIASVYFFPHIL